MKVLFCTDGSEISLISLGNASRFIQGTLVDTICVIDWSFLPESMTIDYENYSKTYENIADSVLVYAENEIKEKGLVPDKKIKSFGSAVEGILEQIEKESYDLIIIGSHGKKGLQKWLGSVSRQVVSNTEVPVFISKKKTKGEKILFTTDGSNPAYSAIKHATSLFNLHEKEIFVMSVKENPELLPIEAALDKNWLDNIEKQQKIHATKAINKAKGHLELEGLTVENEMIATGNPAQKIIELVNREDIDLVIMGARSKSNLSSILLGSVSKRVLENTHSDVLIIRK
jgi:nucleotide-binding universal stress UspA family protein